jgi:hypothetical protein
MATPRRPPPHIFGTLKGHRRFFATEDDQTLRQLKLSFPRLTWPEISARMPGFTPRQLRERWCNYLSPALRTTTWTDDEDRELVRLHKALGPRWGVIGDCMGNRSAPDIKNRFRSVRRKINKKASPAPPSHDPSAVEPQAAAEQSAPPLLVKNAAADGGKKASEQSETPQATGTEFSIQSMLC